MLKAMKMNDLGGGKAHTSLPEDMRLHEARKPRGVAPAKAIID